MEWVSKRLLMLLCFNHIDILSIGLHGLIRSKVAID
jgi:hypothetical protein